MKRILMLACAAAIVAGSCGCAESARAQRVAAIAAGSPAPSDSSDPSHRIDQYLVGEDTDFADLQGDFLKRSGTDDYYRATKPLPGASACSIYLDTQTHARFGSCDFAAPDRAAADRLYQTWIANVQSAEPYDKTLDVTPLPSGVVEATLFTDDKEIHGIYVSATQSGDRRYRVTMTFAKMSALRS